MNTPARLVRYEETVGGYGAWIAWRHSDRAVFMAVVAAIRQRIPSDGRVYAPTSKAWCIDKDELPKLYDVLPELRERLHGAQPARPLWHERPAVPPAVAAALNELYVVPGAPWLIVQACFRALSKRAHPDRGGTTSAQRALNAAYATAGDWYEKTGAKGDAA